MSQTFQIMMGKSFPERNYILRMKQTGNMVGSQGLKVKFTLKPHNFNFIQCFWHDLIHFEVYKVMGQVLRHEISWILLTHSLQMKEVGVDPG